MVDFAFLDSGIGGLPYMFYLKEKSPESNCVYIADTKNFPYGEKSQEKIIECALECVKKIITKFSPKVIVIACNTMSVNVLDSFRKTYPEQLFVGTVPAIKLAAEVSKNHCIGLLATNSTVNHPYNKKLKEDFASDCKMISRGDPELISFIEHQVYKSTETEIEAACKPAVDFFRSQGCDVIILGCTHFLNISKHIQNVAGESIKVIDSKSGVIKRALNMCGKIEPKGKSPDLLFVTGQFDEEEKNKYERLCLHYKLNFGGILQ